MSALTVSGGLTLSGKITVGGSKNAALPIIFATILLDGVSVLTNVPKILDVDVAIDIISQLGAVVERHDDTLIIDTTDLTYCVPSEASVSKIRASSYLLGACMARFGRARVMAFGGCNFENRPIDMHLCALCTLGATILDGDIYAKRLKGADIRFEKVSVGATVNALLLATGAKGRTRIFGYAKEPHVYALVDFLKSAGADISFSAECITVFGNKLHGGRARIIPDMIEAGTYLLISAATGCELRVCGVKMSELESFVPDITKSGIGFSSKADYISPFGSIDSYFEIITGPFPAFPTDMQPQCAPLMARCGGGITDEVWHGRFGYLDELAKFGLNYTRVKNSVHILPSMLRPANVFATDLRGGAAALIAALSCFGESVIESAEIIDRGYENIVEKLCSVGAKIKRIES